METLPQNVKKIPLRPSILRESHRRGFPFGSSGDAVFDF